LAAFSLQERQELKSIEHKRIKKCKLKIKMISLVVASSRRERGNLKKRQSKVGCFDSQKSKKLGQMADESC